ncbi:DoxX family protein [Paenibacillus monticola]|uniref:DoxX family membrane protein n=1 Tax=Paenibacillus monticola TaxID=2666075 RepID=A0A7X2H5W9_9BACL|nr:DoxX family protein [Paenibacillus monticola]MRN54122.1 DoxX family membrane protein [Paenibacillus monticola]
MVSVALLLLRVVIGVAFVGHGAQKLFGWFGGYGPKGTGGYMESIGMKPGVAMAVLAGLMELVGGILFVAGLFTPVAAVLIIATMLGAIIKVHAPNGFWSTSNGVEFPLTVLVIALAVALAGPGSISLDALFFN